MVGGGSVPRGLIIPATTIIKGDSAILVDCGVVAG
jgi:hypothetical protein